MQTCPCPPLDDDDEELLDDDDDDRPPEEELLLDEEEEDDDELSAQNCDCESAHALLWVAHVPSTHAAAR